MMGRMERHAYRDRFNKEDDHWWFLARRAAIAAYLAGAHDQHEILDIGAGTAGTSEYLKRWGDVTAIENNQEALLLASQRDVRMTAGDAEALPAPAKRYDIVFMLDTLAHRGIRSQERALAEAWRTLRPGGHLIVTVPALPMLKSPHDRVQHLSRRYRKRELIHLLESQGFSIDRATYLYWLMTPLSFLWRFFERFFYVDRTELGEMPAWLRRLALKVHLLEARLLGFFELPWGSNLMIRAKKPAKDPAGSHPLSTT